MKLKTDNATGETVYTFDDDTPDATFHANDVNPNLQTHAMMKGFENKVKDTAAIARKQSDGTIINVTESMRRIKIVEMIDHLESGGTDWNLKGTGRKPAQNTAILTLATKLGKSYEEAEAYIANLVLDDLAD